MVIYFKEEIDFLARIFDDWLAVAKRERKYCQGRRGYFFDSMARPEGKKAKYNELTPSTLDDTKLDRKQV